MRIILTNNSGFKWFIRNEIHVKGSFFTEDNHYYEGKKLLEYFEGIVNEVDFRNRILHANGNFAVVVRVGNTIYAAVDRLRSIPLFCSMERGGVLSDRVDQIQNGINESLIDDAARAQFECCGYVIGDRTTIKNVWQIQAGEYCIIEISSGTPRIERYFLHEHKEFIEESEEFFFDRLTTVSQNVFHRLIQSASDRTLVVPLSGGYDSRYIVVMLKQLGYENVLCYTYGKKGSAEVKISRRVANKLGYKWQYIPYSREAWLSVVGTAIPNFFRYAFNWESLPCIQEFYALYCLKKQKLVNSNTIVVPGYCGDLLGGSYLLNDKEFQKNQLSSNGLVEYISKKHFNSLSKQNNSYLPQMKQQIQHELSYYRDIESKETLVSANEAWFTRNKVAKYVVNAVRLYEYFGYEWRLPLWDNELIEFWYRIPIKYRVNKQLYDSFLFQRLFKPYLVDMENPVNKTQHVPFWRKTIKQILPSALESTIRHLYHITLRAPHNNMNSFDELAQILLSDLPAHRRMQRDKLSEIQVVAVWALHKMLEGCGLEKTNVKLAE